jgi:hypothetical protein
MKSTTAEKELVELEKQFWQAMKDHDVDTMVRLTDFPCLVAGPQGVARVDQEAFTGMMKNPRCHIESFDVKDVEVRMLRDDVAVVAYKVHEQLTVDGKGVQLDAADASTWVRRGDRWVCAAHSETLLGDPFGRDRQPANSTRL